MPPFYLKISTSMFVPYLCSLLVSLCPDSEESPEEVVGHLKLGEDVGEAANGPKNLANLKEKK